MAWRVYHHYLIDGYPASISKIVSDAGYGKNDYIETRRSLVIITAPWSGQRQDGHLPVPAVS